MHYLHKQGVAHLDLKSLNVLIGVDFTPKICDFGLCREGMVSTNNAEGVGSGDGTGAEEEQPMGTFEWMGKYAGNTSGIDQAQDCLEYRLTNCSCGYSSGSDALRGATALG